MTTFTKWSLVIWALRLHYIRASWPLLTTCFPILLYVSWNNYSRANTARLTCIGYKATHIDASFASPVLQLLLLPFALFSLQAVSFALLVLLLFFLPFAFLLFAIHFFRFLMLPFFWTAASAFPRRRGERSVLTSDCSSSLIACFDRLARPLISCLAASLYLLLLLCIRHALFSLDHRREIFIFTKNVASKCPTSPLVEVVEVLPSGFLTNTVLSSIAQTRRLPERHRRAFIL